MADEKFSRLTHLTEALARAWEALDGTRQVEAGHDRKTGEPYYATESAAPLLGRIVELTAAIESCMKSQTKVGDAVDEVASKRAARQAASQRRASPKRARR
jgi:hypothetical protein